MSNDVVERKVYYHTHDYENDTKLEYVLKEGRSELTLTFASEDPDYGTEELYYNVEPAEDMKTMARELREELSTYIDYAYSPVNHEQPRPSKEQEEFYDDYSYTSLIAWESALMKFDYGW